MKQDRKMELKKGPDYSLFQRTQMAGTFISRVFGLLRVLLVGALLGDGRINDIFQAVYRVVNVLRNSIGEEAIKNSFLPAFKKYQEQGSDEYVRFLNNASFLLASVLVPLVLGGIVLAPWFIPAITKGFSPEDQGIAVAVARLLFPFLLFIGSASFFMGLLYCEERNWGHVVTSLAPIGVTFGVLILYFFHKRFDELELLYWVAIAQVGGAVLQLIMVLIPYYAKKLPFFFPSFRISFGEAKDIVKQWIPASLGASVMQLNLLFDTFLASFLMAGAVTALSFASRLFNLPIGLFGVSVAVSLHASLAKHWVRNDRESLLQDFFWGMRRIHFFAVPSAAGLILLGTPIARCLFQYGRFGEQGVEMIGICLIFYGMGIPFFCTNRLLKTAFSACQDNRSYALGDLFTVMVNIGFSITFFFLLGWLDFPRYPGLAFGTTLAAVFQSLFLSYLLQRPARLGAVPEHVRLFFLYLFKLVVATVLMGGAILVTMGLLESERVMAARIIYIATTLGIILMGLCIYGIVTYFFGIGEARNMVNKLRHISVWFR